ncbi:MAG: 3-isopropylmalate dehydrogenase [Lachnospiraceae bacterium]|nr:3-isopropylmalate dehydrogenase [Lachnospiraceae bacterium]
MNEGKLQWHSAFYATFRIELEDETNKVQIETEHLLGKKPMQIDLLVIKKQPDQKIEKNIGKIFRTHNIIEYKSPGDYLSINDFYKVYGYTCFYQADTEKVFEINPQELTITFVTNHYPKKMLKHIRKLRGITAIKRDSGIYELIGDSIPMQVIVIKELSKKQNYWLQSLRNNLQSGGEIRELLERYEEKKDNLNYQAVMDVLTRANWTKMEEERIMCEALRELFAEDLKEAQETGEKLGFQEGKHRVALNLSRMGMAAEDIAKAVEMQLSIVQEWIQAAEPAK